MQSDKGNLETNSGYGAVPKAEDQLTGLKHVSGWDLQKQD